MGERVRIENYPRISNLAFTQFIDLFSVLAPGQCFRALQRGFDLGNFKAIFLATDMIEIPSKILHGEVFGKVECFTEKIIQSKLRFNRSCIAFAAASELVAASATPVTLCCTAKSDFEGRQWGWYDQEC
jgi:hypothetical protein